MCFTLHSIFFSDSNNGTEIITFFFFRGQAEKSHDFSQQNSSMTSVTQKQDLCHLDVINLVKKKRQNVPFPLHNVLFYKAHKPVSERES